MLNSSRQGSRGTVGRNRTLKNLCCAGPAGNTWTQSEVTMAPSRVVLCPFVVSTGHVNPMLALAQELAEHLEAEFTMLLAVHPGSSKYRPFEVKGLVVEVISVDVTISKARAFGVRNATLGVNNFLIHGTRAIQAKLDKMARSESPPQVAFVDVSYQSVGLPLQIPEGIRVYKFSAISAANVVFNMTVPRLLPSLHSGQVVHVHGLPPLQAGDYEWCHFMKPEDDEHLIVMNTCESLEAGPLQALKKIHKLKLLTMGPLVLPPGEQGNDMACVGWLAKQQPRSVLYVCFGSWLHLSKEQVLELGVGLESSSHHFVLVLPDQEAASSLPDGFHEMIEERGFVMVGWAPQQLVLAHESIGAVANVCGWNTTLECLSLAGVPMIGWPMFGDQSVNCRYLVDGLKVAIEVKGDEERSGLVTRAEVKRAVQLIMGTDSEIIQMRELAGALKAKLRQDRSNLSNRLMPFVDELKAAFAE